MADFSYLSSPQSDDSAVEDLISQAIDLSVVEQIAALNTSHLSDSVLPTHLESRFLRLKSFPEVRPKNQIHPPSLNQADGKKPRSLNQLTETPPSSPDEETRFQTQSRSGEGKKLEIPADEEKVTELDFSELEEEKGAIKKSRDGYAPSPPISSESGREAASSQTRRGRCVWRWFCCSAKGVRGKKSKEEGDVDFGSDFGDWGLDDEFLSDLSAFSVKDQQRRLQKALKEQEKVSREAEKMVKWVRQVSARMKVSVSDDEKP